MTDTVSSPVSQNNPSAHTQGPWSSYKAYIGDDFYILGGTDRRTAPVIANVDTHGYANESKLVALPAEANARLMAAAPDLLAETKDTADLLRRVLACPKCHFDDQYLPLTEKLKNLSAMIARAEGGQP